MDVSTKKMSATVDSSVSSLGASIINICSGPGVVNLVHVGRVTGLIYGAYGSIFLPLHCNGEMVGYERTIGNYWQDIITKGTEEINSYLPWLQWLVGRCQRSRRSLHGLHLVLLE